MIRIESYSFGHIVIDGKEYCADLIIYPDGRIQDSWWRRAGHGLELDDIAGLVEAKPEIIITGTGADGLMSPDPKLSGALKRKGIEFKALPTGEAVKLYNELCKTKKTGACLHLTC